MFLQKMVNNAISLEHITLITVLTGPIKLITGHGHTKYVNINHFWCLVFSSASRS